MRDWGRTLAIQNAYPIIDKIEQYKILNGEYPENSEGFSLKKTGVIGVPSYLYERDQNSYTLTFTQNVLFNFNFEVVTYDPTDSHDGEGEMPELIDTGFKHWMYYIYD